MANLEVMQTNHEEYNEFLNTQTRGHLNNVYFLCLHKQSILSINVKFTNTKIQYSA